MHTLTKPNRTKRRFWRFLRCNSGVTAVEFALISPIFLLLIFGIVEFSLIMFTSAVMESATTNSARTGKTGFVQVGISRQQLIVNSINDRTAGLLDPTKITINTKVYSGFDKVGDAEPYTDTNGNGMYSSGEPFSDVNSNGVWDADMGSAGLGNANDIVLYEVSYPWLIMTPIISTLLGTTYNITVRSVVKNEPYNVPVVR